jgi:putative membrane protein
MNLPSFERLHLAGIFGVALLIGLTLYGGLGAVAAGFASAGWGTAIIVFVRLVQILISGVAWRCVLRARILWWVCPLLRWVREGINVLLPVAQVGGEIVGARLLTKFGVGGATATASVLADMLVQVTTQLVFCLLGLGLFFIKFGKSDLALWMSGCLLLFAVGVGGFFVVQRWGGVGWVEKRIVTIAIDKGWPVPEGVVGLADSLEAIYRDPSRLALAGTIHMAIWMFGACEVWLALYWLGQPVDFGEALVIESLSHAARAAVFIVPGGVGIQEGAIVALGAVYGLSPQFALTAGLLKRVPDLILGAIGLLIWQVIELRGLRSRSKEAC